MKLIFLLCRVDEDEIDDQCTALRKKLEAEDAAGGIKRVQEV